MPARMLAAPAGVVAALLLGGCGGTGAEGVPTAPDAGPTVGAEPPFAGELRTCESPELGFVVSYPGDWEANAGNGLPACTVFAPGAVAVPDDGSVPPEAAIAFRREELPLAEAAEGAGEERTFEEETPVGGYEGLLVEGTDGEGVPFYRFYVEVGESTLVAEAYGEDDLERERNRRVLDELVETIEIVE